MSLDFPGHGESGKGGEHTIERYSVVVAGLMKNLGIEKAVFAGHSLGGMVGMRLALDHPDLVKGLVLIDTSADMVGYRYQRFLTGFVALFGRLAFRWIKGLIAGYFATGPTAGREARRKAWRECSKVSNDVMVDVIKSIRWFSVRDRLGGITCPALIIVGRMDLLTDIRHSRVLAGGLADSTLEVIPGAGHMTLLEKPDAVNRAMGDFLKKVYQSD